MGRKYNRERSAKERLEYKASKISVSENRGIGQYWYGDNDQVPQELLNVIQQSGTAMLCIEKAQSFIAKGFKDERLNGFKFNPEETAKEVAYTSSPDAKIFKALCLRVLYRADGTPGVAYHVPFRHVRKNIDGTLKYNPRMYEQFYNRSEDVIYKAFDPSIAQAERMNIIASDIAECGYQKGELYYHFNKTPFNKGDIYPFPKAYSDIESIKADSILQDLEQEKLDGKYNSDLVISRVKTTVNPQPQVDSALVDKPELPDANQEYDKAVADFQSGRSKILDLTAESFEAMPKVDSFNGGEELEQLAAAADRIPRRVCRVFDTQPVLIGMDVAAMLGNQQAMANAMKMYLFDIKAVQSLIVDAFTKIFPGYDWSLQETPLFEFLPPEILGQLTADEKRALGGYAKTDESTITPQNKLINLLNSVNPSVASSLVGKMDAATLSILLGQSNTPPNAA